MTDKLPEGVKFDEGKARWDLLSPWALEEVARVAEYGARKYEDRNWEKGIAFGRVFAAGMRHAWAWWRGEEADPETELHHLAHAAWCLLALLHYQKLPRYRQFDSRP